MQWLAAVTKSLRLTRMIAVFKNMTSRAAAKQSSLPRGSCGLYFDPAATPFAGSVFYVPPKA